MSSQRVNWHCHLVLGGQLVLGFFSQRWDCPRIQVDPKATGGVSEWLMCLSALPPLEVPPWAVFPLCKIACLDLLAPVAVKARTRWLKPELIRPPSLSEARMEQGRGRLIAVHKVLHAEICTSWSYFNLWICRSSDVCASNPLLNATSVSMAKAPSD